MPRLPALAAALLLAAPAAADPKPFRLGFIGTDTSHVTALANVFHGPKPIPEAAGFKIVAAYKGGSPDLELSRTRVDGFAKTLSEKYGIEIVDSIDTLLGNVDGVLLTSVDGRPHLAQARQVLKAGKPVFIDKPVSHSLADALEIYRLAAETKTPCFSSSGLRFNPDVQAVRANPALGGVVGCDTFGPVTVVPFHPDLGYYGIHGIEILFTVLGPGVKTVTRVAGKDADVAAGVWADGRVGTFRGLRAGKAGYGGTAFGLKGGPLAFATKAGYEPLAAQVAKFFKTGVAPVSAEETLDILAFIEAADESKKRGGAAVEVAEVYAAAKAKAAALSSGGK
jgi:hypothetical protein